MLGDVVGAPGLAALEQLLPALKTEYRADFVTVNGENAASGFGMTEHELNRILAAGADAVTSGNHIWEKREFWPILEGESPILRPANYPEGSPGKGWLCLEKDGMKVLLVNLQGRESMPHTDCPFKTMDRLLDSAGFTQGNTSNETASPRPPVLVDFHAEASQEKEALAFYLDGRVSLVAGTHTHVQTADERILPKGTAYITDLGMTGPVDSILGMDKKICLDRSRTQVLYRMECAQNPGTVQGIIVEIDAETGKALSIERIRKQ
jgi:metallophosphoesterase (TIGR00282 family)